MAITHNKVPGNTQGTRVKAQCDKWAEADVDWAHDRSIVSKYYSGVIAETEEDQDTLGLVDHSNFNVGRRGIIQAREETLSMFLKPRYRALLKYRDFDGTPKEKKCQEGLATSTIDKFVWRDPNMISVVEALTDQHVAHGDSLLMFPPKGEGWRPFNARILTDADSPQDPSDDNFKRWAVYSDIQIGDALRGIENGDEGWQTDARAYLKGVWNRMYDSIDNVTGTHSTSFDDAVAMSTDYVTEEERLGQGDLGANLCDFVNTRMRCYYYYQKDFSDPEEGTPIDVYIVARFDPDDHSEVYNSTAPSGDPLLFKMKAAYDSVDQAIAPFVLDANIGSEERTWGTIKGLAHINYNADRWTNLLVSAMMNSAVDNNTPVLSVSDEADYKQMQQWVREGYRANSVLPAGVNYLDKSKNGVPIGEMLNMVGYLQREANQNAISHTGQAAPDPAQKRVGILQEQNNASRTSANRGDLMSLRIDQFFQEMYERIFESIKDSMFSTSDSDGIKKLRKLLRDKGVQLEWLRPENVEVVYARLIGEGDPAERTLKLENIIQRIGLIPAEARSTFIKEWLANASNWEFAEEAFEYAEEESTSQKEKAQMKALAMLTTLTVAPVTVDDVPETQIRYIIEILQTLLDTAVQNGKFNSLNEIQGFVAVAQYGILLVQEMEGRGQNDLAASFSKEIQRLSTEAQGPIANFNQSQQAEERDKADPQAAIAGAKLQLDQQKFGLETARFEAKQQKDAQVQAAQAEKQEVANIVKTREVHLKEAALQDKRAVDAGRLTLESQKVQQNARRTAPADAA